MQPRTATSSEDALTSSNKAAAPAVASSVSNGFSNGVSNGSVAPPRAARTSSLAHEGGGGSRSWLQVAEAEKEGREGEGKATTPSASVPAGTQFTCALLVQKYKY
jgi:hypothetical protein